VTTGHRTGRPGTGPPQVLVLAHVSDLHIGAHVPAAADTLVGDVRAVDPDLTVVTGDWTMRARPGQFRQARTLLDRLPAPRLLVIGNHDVPLLPLRRLVSPYTGYRAGIEWELDPRLDLPGVRAFGLQSMPRWRWKSGRVSRRQAASVVDLLGGTPRPAVRLLALHHPPLARGPARIVGRAALVRALVVARVDLVLAGHTHVPSSRSVELVHGGTAHRLIEVVAGTATSRRTRGTPRSWTVIRIDPTTVVVEERYELGGCWVTGRTVRYDRSV
jgi:3',5'-cyclic AMP phosphodiesterase CpdA